MTIPVRVRCICVAMLFLLLLSGTAQAQQTINVPADQPTIQAAINAANSGDTVLVASGTYVENINFGGKAVTVTSSGGPAVTTIDGGALGSVVTFSTGETAASVLSGFTIRNGLQNGLPGGGIYISNASPTIAGNIITRNHAAVGCGIYVNGGSPLIQNNTITINDQTGAGSGGEGGGGILVSGTSSAPAAPQIVGNTITNNSVANGGDGGGLSVGFFSSPLIQGNLIQGNTAYNFGGGVALQSYNSPVFVQNIVVTNTSLEGGSGAGLYVFPSSSSLQTFVTNNTIAANSAFDNTSGILVGGFGQFVTFTNNIVAALPGQTAITCSALYSSLSPVFSYNDAFAASGTPLAGICDLTTNPGNISADPRFLSAASFDFHLSAASSAVNAGNNSAPNLPNADFDGNPRIAGTIDLGAYEVVTTSAASISPTNLSFGPQAMGNQSAPQSAFLTSTGNTGFQITSVQLTGPFVETTTCPTLKDPGGFAGTSSCNYSVSFAPAPGSSAGAVGGALTVNGTNGASLLVSLSGTALGPNATASLSTAVLSFAGQTVGTRSTSLPVTLTNLGSPSLAISSIVASQQFSETDNCPAALAGGASCTINVSFAPTATGTVSGTLTIVDNAADSPQSVALSGTGLAPAAVSLSPSSLVFAGQVIGTTSAAQTVTLTNVGGSNLNITNFQASLPFAQTNNCPASLAAGANCTISVAFTPQTAGHANGGVTLFDNAGGSPQSVILSGTGLKPATASLSALSLNFAGQLVGTTSPAQTITLTNTGDVSLNVSNVIFTHPFNVLTAPNCLGSVAAGASCQINVVFQPTASGLVNGLLQVFDSGSDSPQNVNLSGTGLRPAMVSFNVPGVGFAPQIVGTTSVPTQVILSNIGDAALNVNSISTSASFGQTNNCPTTLAGGANCSILVTFTPQANGQLTGTLSVVDSATGSPQTLSLNGTGLDFTLAANPSTQNISSGGSVTFGVFVSAVGGAFNQSVSLSCAGLPAASTCSFSPPSVTPGNGGATASLLIQTTHRRGNTGTQSGTYTITINGTSANLVRMTTVTLIVR